MTCRNPSTGSPDTIPFLWWDPKQIHYSRLAIGNLYRRICNPPPSFWAWYSAGPKDLFAVWRSCSIGIPLPFLQTPPSRVDAVQMDRGKIFIHWGKGKEDRCTILAAQMKETLVEYLRSHKPSYWLIEARLEKKYGANRYATVHSLRQALATQLPEQRNMHCVEGYASVNTTEIYPPTFPAVFGITRKGGDQIKSPLDHLDLGNKGNGGRGVDTE